MTGLAQSANDAELAGLRDVGDFSYPPQPPQMNWPAGSTGTGRWRVAGWLGGGLAGSLAIAWFIFFSPGETGSKAEWFFGGVVLCVVMVSMWQIVTIQRQARQDAVDAAERHRKELAAAEERALRELAMTQRFHRTQLDAQQRLHDAEMEAQRELARVERAHLLAQQQKLAVNDVSRAVNTHANMLASLWNQGASILHIEDRETREQAMNPVFEQIAQVVTDFSVELTNAHMLVEDDHLHRALDRVNDAVMMAMHVAEDLHVAVADGRTLNATPVSAAQRLLRQRAAEARHLAWNLVRTGLDDTPSPTK